MVISLHEGIPITVHTTLQLGPGLLCQHNFEHNGSLKALSIILAQ